MQASTRVQLEASTSGRSVASTRTFACSLSQNSMRAVACSAAPPGASAAAAACAPSQLHTSPRAHTARRNLRCAAVEQQETGGEWSNKLLSLTKRQRKRKTGGSGGGGGGGVSNGTGGGGAALGTAPQRTKPSPDALEVEVTEEELLAADLAAATGDNDLDGDEWGGDAAAWGGGGGGGGKMVGGEKRLPPAVRCFDTARIYIKSGDGGAGCVAFRREPFVEHGGPNGGNGGRGGNVWAVADDSINSLLPFRNQAHFRAHAGAAGAALGGLGEECVGGAAACNGWPSGQQNRRRIVTCSLQRPTTPPHPHTITPTTPQARARCRTAPTGRTSRFASPWAPSSA
jgi:hypothetical protein